MAILEDIGRTNTLRAVTQDLTNQAISTRSQDLQERQVAVQEAESLMKQQAFNEERQQANKPVPLDMMKQTFQVPAIRDFVQNTATTLGMVENIDGVPVVRTGNAKELAKFLKEGENPKIMSALATNHYRNQVGQLKQEMAQYQEKAQGKDLSQDKKFQSLAQNLQQAQGKLVRSLEISGKVDEYNDLIKKGYAPRNVKAYMQTGDMEALGQPVAGLDATPTDIDDFVRRANEEAKRTTGRPLTPGEMNEAALRFKRAQAEEVANVTGARERAVTAEAGPKEEAKAAGKGVGEFNMGQYEAANAAVGQVEDIDRLIDHIDSSEAITGLGAELFKNIERVKTLLGSEVAAGKVSDTELLDTMMGSEVFPMIKSLGIGARGMDTPAEREFMRQVLTGSLPLNKNTLRKMAEIRKKVAERAIKRWNRRTEAGELDRFYEATGLPKKKIKYGGDKGGKKAERVQVISPDGQTGTIPASQLEDALAQGYRRG